MSACVLAAASGARADTLTSEAPRRVADTLRDQFTGQRAPDPPDISDYGRLARGFMVYISGKPFLFSTEDIDRIIDSPWSLNPSTAAKLDALPPRFRLRVYSVLAGRLGEIRYEPPGPPGSTLGGIPPLQVTMDGKSRAASLQEVTQTFDGYFRTEELADLVVFGLSRQAYFPKTEAGWQDWKASLVHYDLVLGLAGLAALAGVHQGNIDVGGLLLKSPHARFRLGWYGAARQLGFNWQPILSGGVQAAMPGFDASAGWVESIRAELPNESRALQLVVREHWLNRLSRTIHWEVAATGKGEFVVEHTDPTKDKTFRGEIDFYARKPGFFRRPAIDLLMEGTAVTDFRRQHLTDVSVGLEDTKHSIAGALRATAAATATSPLDLRVAAVLGGSLGVTDDANYYRDLEDAGRRLKEAIRYVRAIEERQCSAESEVVKVVPARVDSPDEATESHATQRLAALWRTEAMERLRQDLARYKEARKRCASTKQRLPGPLTEEEADADGQAPGTLTGDELRFATDRVANPHPAVLMCPARAQP